MELNKDEVIIKEGNAHVRYPGDFRWRFYLGTLYLTNQLVFEYVDKGIPIINIIVKLFSGATKKKTEIPLTAMRDVQISYKLGMKSKQFEEIDVDYDISGESKTFTFTPYKTRTKTDFLTKIVAEGWVAQIRKAAKLPAK